MDECILYALNTKLKHIDLFAGAGGFQYAFPKEKVETVYANDILESSQKIYKENFPNVNFEKADILNKPIHEIPEHDILTAGISCQPFSIARGASQNQGFNDERSKTFWKTIQILQEKQPMVFIIENVKNLISHDKGKTFERIQKEIQNNAGYTITWKIMNTSKHSTIPQHRERIYIVGSNNKTLFNTINTNIQQNVSENTNLNTNFRDYLDENVSFKYFYTKKENKISIYETLSNSITKYNTIYQYRRYYVREMKTENLCPTLTENMGSGGHNVPIIKVENGIRKFTPRETFRLQGFPDSFIFPKTLSDSSLYSLAGNAITVPIGKIIGYTIIQTIWPTKSRPKPEED